MTAHLLFVQFRILDLGVDLVEECCDLAFLHKGMQVEDGFVSRCEHSLVLQQIQNLVHHTSDHQDCIRVLLRVHADLCMQNASQHAQVLGGQEAEDGTCSCASK